MKKELSVSLFELEKNGGLRLVITLKDDGFIMVDGGICDENYEYYDKKLMDFLSKRSSQKKPKILGWFFTHYHHDHIQFAANFLKNNADKIEVNGFYINSHGDVGDEFDLKMKQLLLEAISAYPEATVHVLKTGEKIAFPNCVVDVLLSEADLSPKGRINQNFVSAAFNVRFDTGRTFTVLGDCDEGKLQRLIDPADELFRCDEDLKCDVLQCAHHGLPMGSEEAIANSPAFYKKLSPSICLFPVHAERMATDERFSEPKWAGNYYLMHSGAQIFNHSHTVTVNMEDLSVVVED